LYAGIASATTTAPDTQPPTAPTNLAATAASTSQINLSWTASTDNVGVTGYQVEHCQGSGCTNFSATAPVVTGTSSSDSGLSAGTTYSYQVRATDAANSRSAYSSIASATTQGTLSGLVAAYAFGEGSGTTTADATGKGHTGTLLGGATFTASGKYGNGLSLNGSTA